MSTSNFTTDARLKITEPEIARLQSLITAGDRAGFYMAYFAMSENGEGPLTSNAAPLLTRSTGPMDDPQVDIPSASM